MRTLQAELALHPLPQEAILERGAAIAGLPLPSHFLLDRLGIDGARILGRRLLHQHAVDGRVLRGDPQLPRALGFVGDGVEAEVVAEALLFLASGTRCPLTRYGMAYLLVLISTITPPDWSGATRSGRPAEAGCPCRFSTRMPPGLGPAPM